ncbi:outer membrane protein assembly factor BamB family protein [Haloarchaeobius iranensis]|uniref:Outer membrane protein assembly factor BamB, contains PQQ-like beta-propeller repeat n=1 Tax=Haloarchaeobius iranensis TaxID=996166 RepID=A0A1G9WXF5_9EURY|nr:PQQ-binding-like beta-propeller repeat protein [Haloarchaeobius iranensis]SDM89182.1 Outer membrane protein assembly factor BamB, contains PQQ-like beta-propeller repeat [Haloarchaeobius iranensis]
MSPSRPSRRGLLAAGVGALAGGQLLRPSLFREPFDADPSVSTDEWLLPGRTPTRRSHVPVPGGTALTEHWTAEFDSEAGYSLVVADGTVVWPVEDGGLTAYSVADGDRRWRYRTSTEVEGGIAAAGGHLCYPTGNDFHVLGLGGDGRWRLPAYGRRSVVGLFDASYLPVGSTLFGLGERGLEARDLSSGLRHWFTEQVDGESVYPYPSAYADGTLYCSEGSLRNTRLSAFDASDGSRRWRTDEDEYLHRRSAVDGDTLLSVAGSNDSGSLRAFSTEDGSLRWKRGSAGTFYEVAVGDGIAVCASFEGDLNAFDVQSGERRWRSDGPDDLGGVVRTDDYLYVHRSTGVEVREPVTGERLSTHELDGGEARALAYADDRLFALQEHALAVLEVEDA